MRVRLPELHLQSPGPRLLLRPPDHPRRSVQPNHTSAAPLSQEAGALSRPAGQFQNFCAPADLAQLGKLLC